MNPFDLSGPAFLLLYALLLLAAWAAVTIVAMSAGNDSALGTKLRLAFGGQESGRASNNVFDFADPYLVATLRGLAAGRSDDAVRVAMYVLADGGLIERVGGDDRWTVTEAAKGVTRRRAFENDVLAACGKPKGRTPREVAEHGRVARQLEEYRTTLEDGRLVHAPDAPNPPLVDVRWVLAGIFAIFALTKIVVALSRGHTNVIFLTLLGIVAFGVLMPKGSANTGLTLAGGRLLSELEVLFMRLRYEAPRYVEGKGPDELALALAVFGSGVLVGAPSAAFAALAPPATTKAKARPGSSDLGGSDWSSDSSCSSSSSDSGSSCGSSCGGGCGGGCGGCGS